MNNTIYWKEYDEPIERESFIDGHKVLTRLTGGYVCEDERVEKCWLTCGLNPEDGELGNFCFHFLFKNGERKDIYGGYKPCGVNELIDQATQYLQSLK